jgi:ribonuclease P/MRP protein subunit POP1
MLKALGFTPQGLSQSLQKKWKSGTRFAGGWISERDQEKRLIAPVKVIWFPPEKDQKEKPKSANADDVTDLDDGARAQSGVAEDQMEVEKVNPDQPAGNDKQGKKKLKSKLDHRVVIRLHPSAFHQFWQELLKVAKMQRPQVLVEDLRFEIGSIDIQGPGSTEALLGVLRPFATHLGTEVSSDSSWTLLAGVNNPSILPHNAMLCLDVVDPRFNHPPRRIEIPPSSESHHLNELLASWPLDKILPSSPLVSQKTRWSIRNSLPSQKAINRRRALAPPGQAPSITAKDPRIPVMLLASRAENSATKNSQGTWTVLLPWSCVDPVWRSLMYYPLSTAGTPRFGGMSQQQQMAFEQKTPWFPGDLPGTEAGKAWERTESERRFDAWMRRPPKHQIAWDMLDLGLGRRGEVGRGWTCDWEYLFSDTDVAVTAAAVSFPQSNNAASREQEASRLPIQRQRKAAETIEAEEAEKRARRRNTSSPESEAEPERPSNQTPECRYTQLAPNQSIAILKNPSITTLTQHPTLMTVRIMLLDKGSPSPAARIYRLPSIPKPKAAPLLCLPTANGEFSQNSEPQSWPSDGPPPAQPFPTTSSTDSSNSSSAVIRARALRSRWLGLDVKSSSNNKPFPKTKNNKSNIPRHQASYPRESLAKINVLPKNAPQEIVEKWGPDSAFGRGDGEIPKQMPPPPKEKKGRNIQDHRKTTGGAKRKGDVTESKSNPDEENPLDGPAPGADEIAKLLLNPFEQPTEWDKHPPCPDAHDLIGFVTSGGYNLAEGRGTAIGGIWVQRLLEGWQDDHLLDDGVNESEKEKERRKRLCIIRNAGESVGRLGIWEICS